MYARKYQDRAENSIKNFDFLTRFMEEVDTLCAFKAHTFLIPLKFLSWRAEQTLRFICKDARCNGVTCWPDLFNHFPRTYVTSVAICNAINNLQYIRQQSREDEIPSSKRMNDAARKGGNVYKEVN